MSTPPGRGFVSFRPNGSPVYLPLKSVSAQVRIIDTFARVVLTQLYTSNVDQSSAAQYVFPVPASGAVCAFKMRTSDGQVVEGVVKESSKAKNEYDAAILNNRWAGLVYEATPDVFVISLGAIPPEQDVEITIMYVVALSDGDLPGYDHAEFRLQTFVAERYGSPPANSTSLSSSANATFNLTAEIQMTSEIGSISSRSHSLVVDKRKWKHDGKTMYTASARLKPEFTHHLDRDFVLSIQSSKLGEPQCVAEKHPSEMSIALSLTFVPRVDFDRVRSQEYIFVIDRSGSMAGSRINHAKDALLIFLKSLPNDGSLFNVFSFGTDCSSLWNSSQQYSSSALAFASQHINLMKADMGGTEIENSLRRVFMSRNHAIATSIFLLTDGEVWSHDNIFRLVDTEVKKGGDVTGAQLRIFTLGVGDAASTALCEGIARRGNGGCLMTSHNADISQKCARLLAASKIPSLASLGDIAIDWGYVPSRSALRREQLYNNGRIFFSGEYDPIGRMARKRPSLPDPPKVQQVPTDIPTMYPTTRFTVFAILSDTDEIPKTVTLYGTLPDGSPLSLPPVNVYESLDTEEGFPPLLHTLAANRLITELEDGNTASQGTFDENDDELREAVIEAAIVRLGETYQLASQFTSFIAVDESTKDFKADESDESLRSAETDSDRDPLDGLDGKFQDSIDPVVDDDDVDSDILDGKDDDEFYSALSSASSVRSLVPEFSQAPELSKTLPAPRPGGPEERAEFQKVQAFPRDDNFKSSQPLTDQSGRGQVASDIPARLVEHFFENVNGQAGNSTLHPLVEQVESECQNSTLTPDNLDEKFPQMQADEKTSITIAPVSSQAACKPFWTVEETPFQLVSPLPSRQALPKPLREDESLIPSRTSADRIHEVHSLEVVERINVWNEDLEEAKPELQIDILSEMQPAISAVSNPPPVLTKDVEIYEASAISGDALRITKSSISGRAKPYARPISTAVTSYQASPITLASVEECGDTMEVESLEDDMLGLAEPPSAGSPSYKSIESVLSQLSMEGPATAVQRSTLSNRFADLNPLSNEDESILLKCDELRPCSLSSTNVPEVAYYNSEEDCGSDVGFNDSQSPPLEEPQKVMWIPAFSAGRTNKKIAVVAKLNDDPNVPVVSAARLQHHDGSFNIDNELCSLVGKELSTSKIRRTIPSSIRSHKDAENIWATVLAAAYMKTRLADNRDLWIGLWLKATNYIKSRLGSEISFTYLVDEASKLL